MAIGLDALSEIFFLFFSTCRGLVPCIYRVIDVLFGVFRTRFFTSRLISDDFSEFSPRMEYDTAVGVTFIAPLWHDKRQAAISVRIR